MGGRLQRGWLLYEQGRYDLAEGEGQAALAEDPRNADAWCLIAFSRMRAQKSDEAFQAAKELVALAPDWGRAHFVMGKVQADRGQHGKADASLKEAIRLSPEEPHYRSFHGAILLDMGKRDEALAEIEAGLLLDPEISEIHALRGLVLYGLDRVADSEAAYREALRLDPRNDVAHAGLGRIEASRGRADAAVERYRESLRIDPNDAWARTGLLDALRARYPVYGLFLRYVEWTRRMSPRTRMFLFIGLYVVFRFAGNAAKTAEGPARWALLGVAFGYVVFALMSWIADPLFNLLLRMRPEGRLLLDEDEIAASNLVGVSMASALVCGIAAFITESIPTAIAALLFVVAVPASATLFRLKAGGVRRAAGIAIAVVMAAGLVGAVLMGAGTVASKEQPLGMAMALGAIALLALFAWVISLTGLGDK